MRRVALLSVAWLVASALLASDASAAQVPVRLGAAHRFAVLAGQTVTDAGFSTLNGDLGVSPATALTGFPPGTLTGTVHSADPVAAQAQADLTTADDKNREQTLRPLDDWANLRYAGGSVGVAAAAAARSQHVMASPEPTAPTEPTGEEAQRGARQLAGDFTAPTVHIRGERRVRMPRVARLRVMARDNKRVTELDVLVDGRARYLTSLDKPRRTLELRLRFRRGRHTIVAYAFDGAGTNSRVARATVVVR